jgi:hypothetical protein
MSPLEPLTGLAEWAARNFAYNLDHIPADKLAWKPAPSAKSALEVTNHLVGAIKALTSAVSGAGFTPPQFPPATTAAAARELLTSATKEYVAALRGLKAEELGKSVTLPFATMPLGRVATIPLIELINHHGQITYIQTLLGDNEDHFDTSAM